MSEPVPAQPAATLVLLREAAAGGPPELFMQARAMSMGFAAGMMVFPGGKVDAQDRALAEEMGIAGDPDDAAARVAAVRESFEEAGVLLTAGPPMRRELLAAAAPLVAARELSFAAFLRLHGQRIDPGRLVPFTRWVPPADIPHRRYDTRFYLAHVRPDLDAGHDGREATDSHWITAAGALARADSGETAIVFPTRRNLERIGRFDSTEALLRHARETPPALVQPRVEMRGGHPYLCIPEGIGYPVTAEPLETTVRG